MTNEETGLENLAEEEMKMLKTMLNEAFGNDLNNNIDRKFHGIEGHLNEMKEVFDTIKNNLQDINKSFNAKTDKILIIAEDKTKEIIKCFEKAKDEIDCEINKNQESIQASIVNLNNIKEVLLECVYIITRAELNTMKRSGIRKYFYNDLPNLLQRTGIKINDEDLGKVWSNADSKSSKFGLIVSYNIFRRNLVSELDNFLNSERFANYAKDSQTNTSDTESKD